MISLLDLMMAQRSVIVGWISRDTFCFVNWSLFLSKACEQHAVMYQCVEYVAISETGAYRKSLPVPCPVVLRNSHYPSSSSSLVSQ